MNTNLSKQPQWYFVIGLFFLFGVPAIADNADNGTLRFADGTLNGWTVEGEDVWQVRPAKLPFTQTDNAGYAMVDSLAKNGEKAVGVLRSSPFVIEKAVQQFLIAGADGTAVGTNDGDLNYVLLRSAVDGRILRKQRPPGVMQLTPARWLTVELIGQKVYLEIVDNNPQLHPAGYAWIGIADYNQSDWDLLRKPRQANSLFGVKIDGAAQKKYCRTIPFWVSDPQSRGTTTRIIKDNTEIIPINAKADTVYLSGLINYGWENGVAFWPEHPELHPKRTDQVYLGAKIGEVEFQYEDGSSDRLPLIMGATAWLFQWWVHCPEPLKSRPDLAEKWQDHFKLRDDASSMNPFLRYFIAIKPRKECIRNIVVHDELSIRGQPLVSAITLSGAKVSENLEYFGPWVADLDDLTAQYKSSSTQDDFSKDVKALSEVLYTGDEDLPKQVDKIDFPNDMDVARIRFRGNNYADMLNNIWVANMSQINEKFDPNTGFFGESARGAPSYAGYTGVGTWNYAGQYAQWAFSRCSDHYASLAMRCIFDPKRNTNYVDFCDKFLYYHRSDHDPNKGPKNAGFAADRYPKDAPPHWAFIVNEPQAAVPSFVNEIPGNQELDGHAATIMGRWMVWRTVGAPTGGWLTAPRKDIYGKSRWDTTVDAAEFICWLMDYTGMDIIYSEGETTGWGHGRLPETMQSETDPVKRKQNYANADMYEVYPTYVSMVGLRCSAQIAEAIGDKVKAERWMAYANRIEKGMIRLLATGDQSNRCWKMGQSSVYPNQMECLAPAWYSFYYDGLDPVRWNPTIADISRNTVVHQLLLKTDRHPVLGFGYGIGWLTKSALILDQMDDAGKLLENIAKYAYDKNMNYQDAKRGIDWRSWQWIIPEGTNLLPNGKWHRIGDLGNGANQGITLHALEICAGIDDTKPNELKIMPRIPDPLKGIEVENFPMLIPENGKLSRARVWYSYNRQTDYFELKSNKPLPSLSVRIGPFNEVKARDFAKKLRIQANFTVRAELSGNYNGQPAWWIWCEGLKDTTVLRVHN